MKSNKKPLVLIYAPTPPPFAGPEVATDLLLRAMCQSSITIIHVRSNVRGENVKKGTFDIEGLMAFFKVYGLYVGHLRRAKPDKVYFLLSSSRIGFFRDAIIIVTAKVMGKTVIAHYRGGNFHNFYAQRGALLRLLIRRILARVDCLIVQADILRKIFGGLFDHSKIKVLYNGIPTPSRHLPSRSEDRPFTILFIGHIAFSKGFYELILAYLRLRESYDIRFHFAGELRFSGVGRKSVMGFLSGIPLKYFGEHTEHIENFIREFVSLSKEYGARYLGVITGEEKLAAFSEVDAFVLPSYTEGFSMSVLEAMSFGLPVIVSSVGALPEIIREGENGMFVKAGDIEDLRRKIEQLILDGSRARRIGETNRHYVREKFSVERIADELVEILREA